MSANSTAATNGNAGRTFSFAAGYTAPSDQYLLGFIMYEATTLPTMYGVTQTVSALPVLTFESNAGQSTTPPSLGATLTQGANNVRSPYVWLLGTA